MEDQVQTKQPFHPRGRAGKKGWLGGSQQSGTKPCPSRSLLCETPRKARSYCCPWGRESSSEDKQGQVSSTVLLQLSQVLGGIEEQQGAEGADVPGEAAKAFFCIILLVNFGAHAHGEVLELLLQEDR